MTCDGCMFLSFSLNIDSILRARLPDDKEVEIPFGVCV